MKKIDENLKEEISNLDRVGFDAKGQTERAGSFLITDNKTIQSESKEESLIVMPISFALQVYDWVGDLLFSLVGRDEDEVTKEVASQEEPLGSFVYVKEGAKIKVPFQSCFFMHTQSFKQVLHNIIVLEPHSELNIVTGCATGNMVSLGSHLAVTEMFVKEGASLTYTMIHDWGTEVVVYPRAGVDVGKSATFTSNYIALTRVKRIQSNPIAYLSDGARAKFNTIIYGRAGSFFDMGARGILNGEEAGCEILSRVASENSHLILRAYIEGRGRNTKGHTECNGLLLSEKSLVYTIPELKAANMETELSHEASIGKIAGEKLNYLMARGLNEDSARALLIRGFLEKGIEGLPDSLKKKVDSLIEKATSIEGI
ncbi:MAG: SufD family Fe-S cluster assembly protein [candidate division WOR-3 bacterium]